MRLILPHPSPPPKDVEKTTISKTQSIQNETVNQEHSFPLKDVAPGVVRDQANCTILQGSEKENIQPVSEEIRGENVNDCNNENMNTNTNEDIKVTNALRWLPTVFTKTL